MTFATGLSGIGAATNILDVVGNNIANSQTTAFKSSRTNFGDQYASTLLGSNTAIGNGVTLQSVQQSFAQGNINFTNNSLDLAINGTGFFVLDDNGSQVYTRAGAFNLDSNGYIVNSLGQKLTGLQATNGVVGNISGDLQVSTANIAPKITTSVSVGANLYASSTPPTVVWSGGTTPSSSSFNNVTSSTIYDSLGNSHVLSMYFIHSDSTAAAGSPNASSPANTNNQWYVAFQIDNQDVPAITGTTNSANLYHIQFNQDGSFSQALDQTDTALANNLVPLTYNLTNGAANLSFNVDLSSCTQFGSPFAVQSNTQDGYTTGQFNTLEIDSSGIIYGRYTNGQSLAMGQIQLASFTNENGLQPASNTSWSANSNSGTALLGIPGSGTLGVLQAGALEGSNVDLTSELVNMINGQLDFQANAKTIQTQDTITQTIINIG